MSEYNTPDGRGFKKGNPGRPKGAKNKLSLHAVDKMIDTGFDPIEAYMELLNKARQQGNIAVEERALSRLIAFRYSSLHHSMVTNADDADLEISVTNYNDPTARVNSDVQNDNSTRKEKQSKKDNATHSQLEGENLDKTNSYEQFGVNVTSFKSKN